jgi:hypothetical protein
MIQDLVPMTLNGVLWLVSEMLFDVASCSSDSWRLALYAERLSVQVAIIPQGLVCASMLRNS